jgi:probable serine/threonine-protein kinase dyrk1
MILVINVTKKYRNSNNYKLDNLINSIRIDRKTSENSRNQEREISISDLIYRGNRNADTNNNNSNNNNNNNYSGSLAYAYSIPSGWREQNYSNSEVTLTDDNNYTR